MLHPSYTTQHNHGPILHKAAKIASQEGASVSTEMGLRSPHFVLTVHSLVFLFCYLGDLGRGDQTLGGFCMKHCLVHTPYQWSIHLGTLLPSVVQDPDLLGSHFTHLGTLDMIQPLDDGMYGHMVFQ